MIYSIDRFEGEFVICEDELGKIVTFDKKQFPNEIIESDCFTISPTGEIIINKIETENRKKMAYDLQQKLMGK